jgi:hypothetical protein
VVANDESRLRVMTLFLAAVQTVIVAMGDLADLADLADLVRFACLALMVVAVCAFHPYSAEGDVMLEVVSQLWPVLERSVSIETLAIVDNLEEIRPIVVAREDLRV